MRRAARIVPLLLLAAGPALGAQILDARPVGEWLTCKRLSGGPIQDLTLVINDSAKTLSVKPDWMSPDQGTFGDDAVKFKDDTITWTFMRGYAVLDRKTGLVAWNDTGEYEYLENIGHAEANDSVDNYLGQMRCKVVGSSTH